MNSSYCSLHLYQTLHTVEYHFDGITMHCPHKSQELERQRTIKDVPYISASFSKLVPKMRWRVVNFKKPTLKEP